MKNKGISLFFSICILLIPLSCEDNKSKKQTDCKSELSKQQFQIANADINSVNIELDTIDGRKVKLSDFSGKVIILNFWATWCGPCIEEMPSLESLYKTLDKKKFVFLAVNLKENTETVKKFLQSNSFQIPVYLDPSETAAQVYGIMSIPTTYIINKKGLILARAMGYKNWNTPGIISALQCVADSK